VTTVTESGNGAAKEVTSIRGTTTTKLLWPENSIPSTFTVCSVTRYTGGSRGRILNGYKSPTQSLNWLHGHFGTWRGVAFYNDWQTAYDNRGDVDDWLVMCGTNAGATPGNVILDQIPIGTSVGGQGNGRLNIGYQDVSNWALHSLLIWDYSLGTVPVPWHTRPCLSNLVTGSVDVGLSMVRFRDAWN
jgi:hypothetical protein